MPEPPKGQGLWCWENRMADEVQLGAHTIWPQLMLTLEDGQGSQWMSGAQRGQPPKAPIVRSELNESPELNDGL